MVLAKGGWPSFSLMVVTLVGGTLAAGGANAINMYIDRDIDRLMSRTQNRPLVTGVVTPRAALFCVFIYSLWLKLTSKHNIVIGGAAGAVPVLVGWAAVAIRHADDYRATGVPMLPVVASPGETVRSITAYTVALVLATLALIPIAGMG